MDFRCVTAVAIAGEDLKCVSKVLQISIVPRLGEHGLLRQGRGVNSITVWCETAWVLRSRPAR
eukprot:4151607-Amphidinium_carterae.1